MKARRSPEPRKYLDTVIGPVAVVPECKVQAVCVNGKKCWEAGYCLQPQWLLDREKVS